MTCGHCGRHSSSRVPTENDLVGSSARRLTCPSSKSPLWVKLRRTQSEHMFSALPPNSDIARHSRHVSNVPTTEVEFSPDYPVGEREARGDRWVVRLRFGGPQHSLVGPRIGQDAR